MSETSWEKVVQAGKRSGQRFRKVACLACTRRCGLEEDGEKRIRKIDSLWLSLLPCRSW